MPTLEVFVNLTITTMICVMGATDRSGSSRRRKSAKPPDGYDSSAFASFAVTVDIVILAVVDAQLQVLLIQRTGDPYERVWALPGGFKNPDETLDEAARRELREETGVDAPRHLTQFGAYGDPGRDPRTNVVTIAYLAVTPEVGEIIAGSDADDAALWPVAEIIDGSLDLAFDHEQILRDAIDRAAEEIDNTDLATAFVGPTFTLSELQNVYEALWGADLDAANFRRSLSPPITSAMSVPDAVFIEPTGTRAAAGPRGGRPAEIYRAGEAWETGSPIKRSRKRKKPKRPKRQS
jgi:8-oxo-dGTP diphosphatase